jgi:hypothetical protein
MPLQSFAQRTVSLLPHGIRRSLLKLARPKFANDFTATTEVEARRRRRLLRSGWLAFAATLLALLVWIESGLGLSYRDSLPVRAVLRASGPTRRSCRPRFGLLSWGSSKIAPPPVQMPCVLSRTSRGPPFGPKLPNSGRVPPLPFFPTTAAYSARHPAGLLHPASGHGVRHVSGSLRARCPKARGRWLAFPGGVLPFEVFPSAAGRFASPRADSLTSLFLVSGRGSARVATFGSAPVRLSLDLRALLRCEVRCEPAGVATDELPDTPLGLVPGWLSMPVPPPLRGVAVADPRGPEGPLRTAKDSVAAASHRGGSRWHPMNGLQGLGPEGLWSWCVRRSDGPRRARLRRRLAGHPGVVALSAPRFVGAEAPARRGAGALGGARGRRP